MWPWVEMGCGHDLRWGVAMNRDGVWLWVEMGCGRGWRWGVAMI